MANYVKLLAVANKLINKNGRNIILQHEERDPKDPSKPWRGPLLEKDGGTPVKFPVKGVFVPPNTVREFGITSLGEGTLMEDMIAVSQQIVIIAGTETDLRQFDTIKDRSESWGIKGLQVLRPGDITLLAFIGVRR